MKKMTGNPGPRTGNILALVVGILGVIFTTSIYFGSSTIERTRQTQRSLGGDQASSLAEAGIMRGMHIMSKAMNDPKSFDKEANPLNFAVMLRYPMPVLSGKFNENPSELGKDQELDVSVMEQEGFPRKVELTLADLRLDGENADWLDGLMKFASNEKVKDFDIKVTFEIENAFRINAKSLSSGEYLVPGIDCEFTTKKDVIDFLENKGRMNFIGEFPDWLSLFNFTIPIQVHIPVIDKTITLATIDPSKIIDPVVEGLTKNTVLADVMNCPPGEGAKLNDFFILDKILRILFHGLLNKPHLYPLLIAFEKDFFLDKNSLWPGNVKVPEDYSRYVEKYGTIKVTSSSIINFVDGTSSMRKIEASKDFKVSDIQPMAPLYSFFCANITNDRFDLNNFGGQFYVNNSSKRLLSKAERKDRKEHPGQIRVNYKPDDYTDETNPGTPIVINTALIGHTKGPRLVDGELSNGALNIAAGSDGLLMLGRTKNMIISKASYNLDVTVNSKNVKSKKGSPLPKELKFSRGPFRHGFNLSSDIKKEHAKFLHKDSKYKANRETYRKSALKERNDSYQWWRDPDHHFDFANYIEKKANSINFLPNPEKFSTNIISFGLAMGLRALGQSLTALDINFPGDIGGAAMKDCFSQNMLPWMGTNNSHYCLPTLGWSDNKTHLFGLTAFYPTLTRDIEGMIAKRYKQWHVTIVGLFAKDRLPLLPFPPPWCFLPPVPVPYWFTDQVITKYDYNMWFMKALDVDDMTADASYSMFDPEDSINMPANFYSAEQFAKKSNYYYASYENFLKDLPNRMVVIDGKNALQLNGITFIAGSLGTDANSFKPLEGDTFYVTGQGMIVCSGNASIGCNIRYVEEPEKNTVFSLVARNGGLIMTDAGDFTLEGSYYTNRGIYSGSETRLNIHGNWVTNEFGKHRMRGEMMIDYVASKVRASTGSLHPLTGKYDPRRYNLALSPRWNAWKVD